MSVVVSHRLSVIAFVVSLAGLAAWVVNRRRAIAAERRHLADVSAALLDRIAEAETAPSLDLFDRQLAEALPTIARNVLVLGPAIEGCVTRIELAGNGFRMAHRDGNVAFRAEMMSQLRFAARDLGRNLMRPCERRRLPRLSAVPAGI